MDLSASLVATGLVTKLTPPMANLSSFAYRLLPIVYSYRLSLMQLGLTTMTHNHLSLIVKGLSLIACGLLHTHVLLIEHSLPRHSSIRSLFASSVFQWSFHDRLCKDLSWIHCESTGAICLAQHVNGLPRNSKQKSLRRSKAR